jgi:hypothetical protein
VICLLELHVGQGEQRRGELGGDDKGSGTEARLRFTVTVA